MIKARIQFVIYPFKFRFYTQAKRDEQFVLLQPNIVLSKTIKTTIGYTFHINVSYRIRNLKKNQELKKKKTSIIFCLLYP